MNRFPGVVGPATGPRRDGGDVIVGEIHEWLIEQALAEPDLESLFTACCRRVHGAGIPLVRAMIGYSTLHPLYRSKTLSWTPRDGLAAMPHTHEAQDDVAWLQSPLKYMIDNSVSLLRRRLVGDEAMLDFPVLEEFRAGGQTDYLAYLVSFEDGWTFSGRPNGLVGSWSTSVPAGFSDRDLEALIRIQRLLAVAVKVRVKDEIAANVLSAYLGPDAGRKVLQGSIRRGDGERIHAIVWYSDLRDSTRLADSMAQQDFLGLLNDYFECAAGAIVANGGEVLRFVGDAVLGIFAVPTDDALPTAGRNTLAAVREALRRGRGMRDAGKPIDFGIGLHIGDVLYGNIGIPSRLEFSVIGPCANEVARLDDLTKTLGVPVLLSRPLAEAIADEHLADLGAHAVKGVSNPLQVFTLTELVEHDSRAQ